MLNLDVWVESNSLNDFQFLLICLVVFCLCLYVWVHKIIDLELISQVNVLLQSLPYAIFWIRLFIIYSYSLKKKCITINQMHINIPTSMTRITEIVDSSQKHKMIIWIIMTPINCIIVLTWMIWNLSVQLIYYVDYNEPQSYSAKML